MTDLHLALIALGAVLVAAVAIYNVVQERSARAKAEKVFGNRPPDALFEASSDTRAEKSPTRREPTLGALPPEPGSGKAPAPDETMPPGSSEELEAEVAPAAEIS
ncbi:MAG TPA: hypothetical protein VII36_05165, partial [Usitatibacter sp.]